MLNGFGDADAIEKLRAKLAAEHGVTVRYDGADLSKQEPIEKMIGNALAEWHRCARPGGGCLISMRDYGAPPAAGTVEIHPYGERVWHGRRYRLRQMWTWQGQRYELALEITDADDAAEPFTVLKTSYLSITPARVAELMRAVGFANVQRVDGRFFQPVLVGTRTAENSVIT